MALDQRGDRRGAQERGVAREHEHVVGFVPVLGEAGEADGHGVARAPLHGLLDELEGAVAGVLDQALGDRLGAVADDHGHAVDVAVGQRVDHPHDHRLADEDVQGLGPLGPHPGAVAGGEHDGREGPFRGLVHAVRSNAPCVPGAGLEPATYGSKGRRSAS